MHNIHIFYYSTSSTTTTSTRTSTTTSQHQHDQQHRITRRCTSRRVRQQQPVHLAVHEDHLLQQQHGSLDWNDHRPQHLLNITSTTTTSSSERRTQSLHQQHRIRHQHHLVHHPRQLHLHLEDRPMQQEIINNIAPEGAQLINIELDNINFIDNISADIINLTYFDFIPATSSTTTSSNSTSTSTTTSSSISTSFGSSP